MWKRLAIVALGPAVLFGSLALASPAISPQTAALMLSKAGLQVGTQFVTPSGTLVSVDDLRVSADGEWIVIRLKPRRVQ